MKNLITEWLLKILLLVRGRCTTVASGPKTRQMGKDGISHSNAVCRLRRFVLQDKLWYRRKRNVHVVHEHFEHRATQYLVRAVSCAMVSLTLSIHEVQACDSRTTILTISGKITVKNESTGNYCFSFNEFFALPRKKITTATVWTNRSDFEGPYIIDVLKKVGAYGTKIEVMAENDYSHTILMDDFKKYNPVLAYLQNSKRLEISDFGPLFLVYPRDTFPETLSFV